MSDAHDEFDLDTLGFTGRMLRLVLSRVGIHVDPLEREPGEHLEVLAYPEHDSEDAVTILVRGRDVLVKHPSGDVDFPRGDQFAEVVRHTRGLLCMTETSA